METGNSQVTAARQSGGGNAVTGSDVVGASLNTAHRVRLDIH